MSSVRRRCEFVQRLIPVDWDRLLQKMVTTRCRHLNENPHTRTDISSVPNHVEISESMLTRRKKTNYVELTRTPLLSKSHTKGPEGAHVVTCEISLCDHYFLEIGQI